MCLPKEPPGNFPGFGMFQKRAREDAQLPEYFRGAHASQVVEEARFDAAQGTDFSIAIC